MAPPPAAVRVPRHVAVDDRDEVIHLHGRLTADDDPIGPSVRSASSPISTRRGGTSRGRSTTHHGGVEQLQRGIVGIELAATRVEAKRTASQNRDERDRGSVRTHLPAT